MVNTVSEKHKNYMKIIYEQERTNKVESEEVEVARHHIKNNINEREREREKYKWKCTERK